MEEDRLDSLATDSPMEHVVDSVEADGKFFLERNVDSSSLSNVSYPREVLKVTEATDFPNVVEVISKVDDVLESQEVAGGNAKSLITSAYIEEGVSAEVLSVKPLSKLEEILGSSGDAIAELKQLFSLADKFGYSDWIQFDESVV
ncbi:hypothetical protein MKX01_006163 [Papaver californicum]|nr:hypothetical protein MKX01_006163 [Papaver californicum]